MGVVADLPEEYSQLKNSLVWLDVLSPSILHFYRPSSSSAMPMQCRTNQWALTTEALSPSLSKNVTSHAAQPLLDEPPFAIPTVAQLELCIHSSPPVPSLIRYSFMY